MTTHANENLFRRNALRALGAKRDGRPIALVPRPWLWLAALCTCFMGVAWIFAWHMQYARKESVRGWLVSEQGVVRITHPTAARVIDVLRQAGEEVRAGDPIARLSVEPTLGDGGLPLQEIVALLGEELAGVERREDAARRRFDADADNLAMQLHDIGSELAALDLAEREQRARVERNSDALQRVEAAAERGAVATIDVLRQQDELATARQSLARLVQDKGRLGRERRDLVARRGRLDTDLELRLLELGSLRNELLERIARNERARLHSILAPVDGSIATLDIVAGSTVSPQQLLVSILPRNVSLAADVYVPSRAIGLVEPGQTVRLRYDAFPHERFGVAGGRVEAIAGYILLPSDVPPAFGVREASYRVRVGLDSAYMRDEHGRYALKPGMTLAADIVLESRSLLDWLTSRFSLRI